MNTPDYSKMTNDDFNSILDGIIERTRLSEVRDVGDIDSILREHFNNQVLEEWENQNPHLAFPNHYPSDRAKISGDSMKGWKVEQWSGPHLVSLESFESLSLAEMRLSELKEEIEARELSAE